MKYIEILNELVKCRSITPFDDGAIGYCSSFLEKIGFQSKKLQFGNVFNLYSKLGRGERNLCFAGHVDVVPPLGNWSFDPFILTERGGILFGRGTNDMKGPLSSCLASIYDLVENNSIPYGISVSFLLTSDEEIMGDNGTKRVVEFLKLSDEKIDHCILCESSSISGSGEYIKIGCRGSMNVDLISCGNQSHVAITPKLENPVHVLINVLHRMLSEDLDHGSKFFPPSSIQLTSIDTGNDIRNVVPERVYAKFNVRFNDLWTFKSLKDRISEIVCGIDINFKEFGESFVSSGLDFVYFLSKSIKASTGITVSFGADGGNSDALFLKDITQVVEIGSSVRTAHTVDEYISIEDLETLYTIYKNIVIDYCHM